jgi:CheY-like chemotaxis protein
MYVNNNEKQVCVLLIEDAEVFQRQFSSLLMRHKARVFLAKSHAEAQEHIAQHWEAIDLILLDACVEPPGLNYDARAFLRFVKSLKRERKIPLRILGFSSLREHLLDMKLNGCTDVCPKSEQLGDVIPELLSNIYEDALSGEYIIPEEVLKPA